MEKQRSRYLPYLKIGIAVLLLCTLYFLQPGSSGTGAGSAKGSGSGKGFGSGTGTARHGNGSGNSPAPAASGRKPASPAPPAAAAPVKKAPAPVKKTPAAAAKPLPQKSPVKPSPAPSGSSPRELKIAVAPREADPPEAGGGEGGSGIGEQGKFFNIQVRQNKNVLFLFDVSGSMGSSSLEGTRLELLKQHLLKAIQPKQYGWRTSGRYHLAKYECGCKVHPEAGKPGLRFGDRVDLQVSRKQIEALTAGGGTNMLNAWQTVLPVIDRQEITEVFFLTDGEDPGFTADIFRQLLSGRKIVVNTISIGTDSPVLKEIAKITGGKYHSVK